MGEKITDDELIDIFNNILKDECYKYFTQINKQHNDQNKGHTYKDAIEFEIGAFAGIPRGDIQEVLNKFVFWLYGYYGANNSKLDNDREARKQKNKINKHITAIKKYQDFIYRYTTEFEVNNSIKLDDLELGLKSISLINPLLDEIYEFNKIALKELETEDFKMLSKMEYMPYHTDRTKNSLKSFFNGIAQKYNIALRDLKPLLDAL